MGELRPVEMRGAFIVGEGCVHLELVQVRGFRSIVDGRLDFADSVNCLVGLNDHGKSNFLRAVHLFFTDQPEPGLPFDFQRDVTHGLRGSRRKVVIDVGMRAEPAHPKLLAAIRRKRVESKEQYSLRRIWRAPGVQTALVLRRSGVRSRVYPIADEGKATLSSRTEESIDVRTPLQFTKEVTRALQRFRIRYLPSTTEAETFHRVGLASQVKRYLMNPYAKGPGSESESLSSGLDSVRDAWQAVVEVGFSPDVSARLSQAFPSITGVGLRLPEDKADLLPNGV